MAGNNPNRGQTVSTVLGRRLGGELLRMREACGMRQAEAAQALTASLSKVTKMERGLVPMRDPDIRALCRLYGQEDNAFVDRLLSLARKDRERRRTRGWWDVSHDVAFAEYIALEDIALRIRIWQMALIPGLFQTAEYIRALAIADLSWDELDRIEEVVDSRAKRQARLYDEGPLQIHAIIWEAALRQQIGGPSVMSRQLAHILELARKPHVTVQVLPYRADRHPCAGGPFNILSFAEDDALDVVFMEGLGSTTWAEGVEESLHYGSFFSRASQAGLSPYDSERYIDAIAKGMIE